MKLITDEKLTKLIEDAFDAGTKYQAVVDGCPQDAPDRKILVSFLVDRSLKQASEQ